MSKFLTTSGTSFQIEKIMIEAKKELVLISPYLKLSKTFFERLQDATKKEVKVIIIFGKDELKKSEEQQIKNLDNIELYFFENLHAKCYYNELEMVITSMNMYEFSEKNNREMGVHIKRAGDRNVFEDAINESKSILNNSTIRFKSENLRIKEQRILEELNRKEAEKILIKQKNQIFSVKGACIRCGTDLPFNVLKPLCEKCFKVWSQFGNENYIEKFCHKCRIPSNESSLARPVCPECLTMLPKETQLYLDRPKVTYNNW